MINYKIILATLACGAAIFATGAVAADLPSNAPAPAPYVAPPPAFTWTGFYIGFNDGWVGSASDPITNTGTDTNTGGLGTGLVTGAIPTRVGLDNEGLIGGGQVGFNWQVGSWVVGAEADIDGSTAKDSVVVGPVTVPGYVPQTTEFNRELDWLSTFRGRFGFTVTPTLLLYGTGGLAVGGTRIGNQYICPTCVPPASTEATTANEVTNTSVGWTLGAGAEWMFAQHWSVKVEYLYADLGRHSSTIAYAYGPSTSTLTSTARDSVNIARVGLNYKF